MNALELLIPSQNKNLGNFYVTIPGNRRTAEPRIDVLFGYNLNKNYYAYLYFTEK